MGSPFYDFSRGISDLPDKLNNTIKDQIRAGYNIGQQIPGAIKNAVTDTWRLNRNLATSFGESLDDPTPGIASQIGAGLSRAPRPDVSVPMNIPQYTPHVPPVRQNVPDMNGEGVLQVPEEDPNMQLLPPGSPDSVMPPSGPKGHVRVMLNGRWKDYTTKATDSSRTNVDPTRENIDVRHADGSEDTGQLSGYGSRANSSQMEISGNTPGAKRLEEESAMDEIRSAGLRQELMRSRLAPQEQAQLQAQSRMRSDPRMAGLELGLQSLGSPEDAANRAEQGIRAEAAANGIEPTPSQIQQARQRGVAKREIRRQQLEDMAITGKMPEFGYGQE